MRRLAALTLPLLLAATACGSSGSSETTQPPSTTRPSTGDGGVTAAASPASGFADWPNYHRTPGKTGHTTGSVKTPLHKAWSRDLTGSVWEEPVIAGGVLVAGTEDNDVYGLNPKTGKTIWHVDLGKPEQGSDEPCGDIKPIGITGSPAYDKATGSVFVVTTTGKGHHTLWALSARTGTKRWHRDADVDTNRDRNAEQQRAPLIVVDHRVIVTYGAHDGDCGNYVGYAASIATSGKGKIPYYAVPNDRQSGMWSPAGPVKGLDGNIVVPTANGSKRSGTKWDHSDGVIELKPKTMKYVRGWAPKNWLQGDQDDLSLSSTSPVRVDGKYIVGGKRGQVWLLRKSLGGVGKQLDTLGGDGYCRTFGGIAVSGHTAVLPCNGFGGTDSVLAVTVGKHSLHGKWRTKGLFGSAIISGKRAYVSDRNSGDLKVLSLKTGHVLHSFHVGSLPTFPSEVVDNGYVFVPTLAGITAVR